MPNQLFDWPVNMSSKSGNRTCDPKSGSSVWPHDLVLHEPRLQLDDGLGGAEVAAGSWSEGRVLEVKLLQGAVVLEGQQHVGYQLYTKGSLKKAINSMTLDESATLKSET